MHWLAVTLVVVLNAVWLFTIVLGIPGTWLMVLTTGIIAYWQRAGAAGAGSAAMIGTGTLLVIVALATAGEIVEFFAGVAGAKRAGGTRRGSAGALLGGLIGAIGGTIVIPVPVIGSLLGAGGGAAVGAAILELTGGRTLHESMRAGAGAGIGRLAGTVGKFAIGALMWLVTTLAAFWP